MPQKRITKQRRAASADRREQVEPELPLDLRDPTSFAPSKCGGRVIPG